MEGSERELSISFEVEKHFHPAAREVISTVQHGGGYPALELAVTERLKRVERQSARNVLSVVMEEVYSHDYKGFSADVAKMAMVGDDDVVQADRAERVHILRILWWIIMVYYEGDASAVQEMCGKTWVHQDT